MYIIISSISVGECSVFSNYYYCCCYLSCITLSYVIACAAYTYVLFLVLMRTHCSLLCVLLFIQRSYMYMLQCTLIILYVEVK